MNQHHNTTTPENMTMTNTIEAAYDNFRDSILPDVVARYGADDVIAIEQAWSDYTDALCKDGALTDLQYQYAPAYEDAPAWIAAYGGDDLAGVLDACGYRMTARWIAQRPEGTSHYVCAISKGGADPQEFFYSMGPAHTDAPELADVMYALVQDALSVENAVDFEDWASDLGLDTDSRKAERMYGECLSGRTKLEKLGIKRATLAEWAELADNSGY